MVCVYCNRREVVEGDVLCSICINDENLRAKDRCGNKIKSSRMDESVGVRGAKPKHPDISIADLDYHGRGRLLTEGN